MKGTSLRILVLAISILSSCKKDDNSVSVADRAQALLGQWAYEAIMTDKAVDINGDGTVNIDLFNTQEISQCVKDNLTFFAERGINEKGSYTVNDNGLGCEEGGQFTNIEQDNYELIDNNVIRFDVRNDMRIQELTKNQLTIETDDSLGGTDVIVTITYRKN